jgi:hypothetical protein
MKSLRKVRVSSLNLDKEVKDILLKVLGESETVYIEILSDRIRIIL